MVSKPSHPFPSHLTSKLSPQSSSYVSVTVSSSYFVGYSLNCVNSGHFIFDIQILMSIWRMLTSLLQTIFGSVVNAMRIISLWTTWTYFRRRIAIWIQVLNIEDKDGMILNSGIWTTWTIKMMMTCFQFSEMDGLLLEHEKYSAWSYGIQFTSLCILFRLLCL